MGNLFIVTVQHTTPGVTPSTRMLSVLSLFEPKTIINVMSELPTTPQTASNCFAGAIKSLMDNPEYKASVPYLAQISHLLVKIDSQVPGAADFLLKSIVLPTLSA